MTAVCCLCAAVTFIFAICLQSSGAQNVSHGILNTYCGQDIVIPTDGGYDQITVNLAFNQFMQSGATCSWEIPVQNISISNQVILTLPSSSCDPSVFKVWEQDPANSVQNPLTVECTGSFGYRPVISQPGFSLRILLNTSLPLSQSITLFHIVPKVWTDDICPRNTPKVIVAPQGSEDEKETLDPTSTLISSLPHNMVCQWVIRSSDEGVVKLQLISSVDTSEMVCFDHFLLSDEESSSNPVSVPLCSRERIPFGYTSTTGSVYITSLSGNSGISPRWYIYFWSVDACPQTPLGLEADKDKVEVLKGSSFSSLEGGQDKQCAWNITSHESQVIKLMQLDAAEFQQDCNNNSTSDYLILNGEKVGMCDSNKFPIWSETNFMEISFHTNTQAARRSFLLRYTAMYKTPCQGHPERKTITGLRWIGQYVRLRPILAGDEDNGHVCQWLYTARDDGKNPFNPSTNGNKRESERERERRCLLAVPQQTMVLMPT